MENAKKKYSIILPTLDESESLPAVIKEIREHCPAQDYELIVVDDSSDDRTARAAEALGARVIKGKRSGLASALMDGFAAAESDYLVSMDSDGQHDPKVIPEMISLLESGSADLVIGSRQWRIDSHRSLLSILAAVLVRPITNNLSDPLSGFFAIRRSAINFDAKWLQIGFKLLPELILSVDFRRICEPRFKLRKRIRGKSKLGLGEIINCVRLIVLLYLKTLANYLVSHN